MIVKCKCQHCSQNLEFDSASAGTTVGCPHCGMETVLFVPSRQPVAKAPSSFFKGAWPVAFGILAVGVMFSVGGMINGNNPIEATAEGFFAAIVLSAALGFYFLPTLVASRKKKRNYNAIFVLNFLAGWTFVGWVIALVWANMEDAK